MRDLETIRDLLYEPSEEAWLRLISESLQPLSPTALGYLCDHLTASRGVWRPLAQMMPGPWLGPQRPAQATALQRALGWEEVPSWEEVPFSLLLPGSFVRGSSAAAGGWGDQTPHGVRLTKACALLRVPVTQGMWEAQAGSNPARFQARAPVPPAPEPLDEEEMSPQAHADAYAHEPERALEQVLWWEAARWCNERSRLDGLEECYRFVQPSGGLAEGFSAQGASFGGVGVLGWRMPTEAEWEYACRAGTTDETWIGPLALDDDAQLDPIAWYDHNAGGHTHGVGRKAPNPWGLYDMLGNVWEWCTDVYTPHRATKKDRVDPVGKGRGEGRVAKGGGWNSPKFVLRAGNRINFMPGGRNDFIGFRLARTVALPLTARSG